MRNMRGALWALGLAGAAYAWRNKDRLQQQFNQFRSNRTPQQLPDYGSNTPSLPNERDTEWQQPRDQRFGGSNV